SDIGATLEHQQVVKSAKAFVDAASKNSASRNIQPGTYRLHQHMSGQAALTLLLDPASRVASNDVLIKEGYNSLDVEAELVKVLGKDKTSAINKAMSDVADFGFPLGYRATSGAPRSVEGFLYPATYAVSLGDTPASILQSMKQAFTAYDHDNGFASAASKVNITPYQALIIASMVESEALHDADRPKVARVILNRLKAGMPLGIDATSIYGALLANPALRSKPRQSVADSINFNVAAPYNTRITPGLPPTPISNPGADSLNAAVSPATGDWLYYVNGDSHGDLYFTSSPTEFQAAEQRCRENNWGCS
ncbi:MAG: endolytic transglycosylase MltG, partial [Jatrophihabitantaceae bacterium]